MADIIDLLQNELNSDNLLRLTDEEFELLQKRVRLSFDMRGLKRFSEMKIDELYYFDSKKYGRVVIKITKKSRTTVSGREMNITTGQVGHTNWKCTPGTLSKVSLLEMYEWPAAEKPEFLQGLNELKRLGAS